MIVRSFFRSTLYQFKKSEKILQENTQKLLGKSRKNRRLRLMVTLPFEAVGNSEMVREMVMKGMDVARINCAHDTPEDWLKMIFNIREAEVSLGLKVKIAMDLNRPKIRTGHIPKSLKIKEGDWLKLCKQPIQGFNAVRKKDGKILEPATVSCTLPAALDYVSTGGFVYFDDGEIKGRVGEVYEDHAMIKIVRCSKKGAKLKPDKGINFPDSYIPIHGLTDLDKEHLRFIAQHADILNFSYVNNPSDVHEMIQELRSIDALDKLGVILKIETQEA